MSNITPSAGQIWSHDDNGRSYEILSVKSYDLSYNGSTRLVEYREISSGCSDDEVYVRTVSHFVRKFSLE